MPTVKSRTTKGVDGFCQTALTLPNSYFYFLAKNLRQNDKRGLPNE